MLKYLENELDRTNEEIKDIRSEKKNLEKQIDKLDNIIENIEQSILISEKNKPYKKVAGLSTIFILATIPFMSLAYCILPVILICDIALGALDIGNIIAIVKNNIENGKIKKSLGNREISKEEKYRIQRDIDEYDKQLSGTSLLLTMKERDLRILKSIIQSEDWLSELKKNPFLLKSALNYELNEYLREVSESRIADISLESLDKIKKLKK